jgi:hypothetical protein
VFEFFVRAANFDSLRLQTKNPNTRLKLDSLMLKPSFFLKMSHFAVIFSPNGLF